MINRTLAALVAAALLVLGNLAAAAGRTPAPVRSPALGPAPAGPVAKPAPRGMPTWPQRFEVRGPEQASFGFAVTQPGPVLVEVRWQGPPLNVQLVGPNKVEQAGAGRVVLRYHVTQEDLRRGVLWAATIAQQSASPAAVAGEIVVRHPPVDPAVAQRATQAQQPTQQQVAQATAQADARLDQAISVRKAEFAQQVALRERAEFERPRMTQTQGNVGSPAADQVGTRALPPQGSGAQKVAIGGQRPPPRLIPITTPPPYAIASLDSTSGGPSAKLVIHGNGFGAYPGLVYLTVPGHLQAPCDPACLQNAALRGAPFDHEGRRATLTSWTDTAIEVRLPELIGVTPYPAQVFVIRNGEASNRMPFSFVPRQEMRVIREIPGDRRHSGTVITAPLVMKPPQIWHTRIPAIPFSEFAGEKGNDEFFLLTQLKNGWTVNSVRFIPPGSAMGVTGVQEIDAILGASGGAYIEQQNGGASPYLNVRWWINPFKPFVIYRYFIEITGPAGVPDGIVML